MPDDPHSVRERLWRAVNVLATSAEPLQKRLEYAGIELAPLQVREFVDPRGRAMFTAIKDRLSTPHGEGSIAAATQLMSDSQAKALAQEIVELDAYYRPL